MKISTKKAFGLCVLGLALQSSVVKADVTLTCEAPLEASLCAEGMKSWRELEKDFGPADAGRVRVLLEQAAGGYLRAGLTEAEKIRLHPRLLPEVRLSVLKHELAHLYLSIRQPEASGFLHEVFALWTSQDDVRVSLENPDFFRRKEALDFLKTRSNPEFARGGKEDRALARVITQMRSQNEEKLKLQQLLKDSFRSRWSEGEIDKQLHLAFQLNPPTSRIDFAFWDGAGRLLESEGTLAATFPTGSVMKPLLIATESDFLSPRMSREHPIWFCPNQNPVSKKWTWQEALVQSCNGFFLDSKKPWEKLLGYRSVLLQLGVQTPGSLISDATGMIPNQKMSLTEIERAYRWLAIKAPFVMDVLRDVPVNGTLANLPDSQWFAQKEIALKTGSVKDEKGEPLHSWIVAIDGRFPRDPRFIAVLHAEGHATTVLLPMLKKKIEALWWESQQKAKVQILGLVPENSIETTCEEGPMMEKKRGDWVFADQNRMSASSEAEAVRCLSGPLTVSFQASPDKRVTRPYYGTLTREEKPLQNINSSKPLTSHQRKARAGSKWVLETSERDYLFEVVASEFSSGRKEALKALALVVRANLKVGWKRSGEICDTTICQVFGQSERMDKTQQQRLLAILHEVQGSEWQSKKNEWLPFSAGGREPWTESRDSEFIQSSLALAEAPKKIETAPKSRYTLIFAKSQIEVSCDDLRLQLALPSCPETIARASDGSFEFKGRGRGHGRGLSVLRANDLAAEGRTFEEILRDAYR